MSARVSKPLELLLDHLGFVVDVVTVVATYRLVGNVLVEIFLFPALFCLDQFEVSHVPLLLVVAVRLTTYVLLIVDIGGILGSQCGQLLTLKISDCHRQSSPWCGSNRWQECSGWTIGSFAPPGLIHFQCLGLSHF